MIGAQVALHVNDAGRVVLGGAMGPEIDQVEGHLLQRDSVEFVLSVTGIRTLRGGTQVWSGEKVHVKSEFVTRVDERRLSKKRTVIAGTIAAATMVFVLTRALQGKGSTDPATGPVDTAQTSRRLP